MKNLKRAMLAVIFALSLTSFVWAQDDQPYSDSDQAPPPPNQASATYDQSDRNDPPGRAARLQYMSGSVSIQPRGTEDWVAGSLNRPLTISDNVWTDKESRAELNVGTGIFRMGDETSVTLTNVNDATVQLELHQGTLDVHVRHLFGGEVYEIDTPNLAFTIQKSGDYRLDVDPNGDATVVTVRKGEGDATGQGPAVRVRSNEQVKFTDGTSLTHEVAEAPPYDGFDGWCAVRDKREDSSLSARYVSPGVVGYEDLDDYGTWREVPPYGHIWVPVAAPGWAPYQYGHWIWVEPWGWTWVDDAPWGYAPFHYGRWVYTSGYWGWAPGPAYVRPVYAPALVTWFGGAGWGVNFGFGVGGGFGWCALGWGEPFYPWYHSGFGYFRGVNISNTRIVNINNYWGNRPERFGQGNFHYANMRAPGGIGAAPVRTLQNGVAIRGTSIRLSGRELANAPMNRVGITPTRNAMLGVHAGQPAAAPRGGMRPVVSRMQPPASFNRNYGSPAARSGNLGGSARASNGPMTPSRMIPGAENARNSGVPSPSMRGVPRPGNETIQRPATPNSNMQRPAMNNAEMQRGNNTQMARNVPRPPTAMSNGTRGPQPAPAREGGGFKPSPAERSVPRPSAGAMSRPAQPEMNSGSQRAAMGNYGSRPNTPSYGNRPSSPAYNNRSNTTVPRPSGPVRPASQSDRFGGGAYGNGGSAGYGRPNGNSAGAARTPSYGGSSNVYRGGSPSYGGSRPYGGGGYSAPTSRGSYGGGYSAPMSRGGGGYNAPTSRGGSYGGYSAPSRGSYGSAPRGGSYGGGAPSSHGGGSYGGGGSHGGGGSYGGGGGSSHASGGGGGHASSGGGHGGHR